MIQKKVNAGLRTWNANGKTAVAIAGFGPGKSCLEFTIQSEPDLKSKFGGTVNLGKGKYRFTGNDICSDVLFSE